MLSTRTVFLLHGTTISRTNALRLLSEAIVQPVAPYTATAGAPRWAWAAMRTAALAAPNF